MSTPTRYGATLGACAAALLLAAAGGAHAGSYSFTFVGGGQNVSGTFETSSASDPAQITSLSGTDNDASILLLSPGTLNSDNAFYANSDSTTGHYLDDKGFAFSSIRGNYEIYSSSSTSYSIAANADIISPGVFTATAAVAVTPISSVSAAPEPGAWALMLGGVGAMGLMLRRRRVAAVST